jgi:hypothetical protein
MIRLQPTKRAAAPERRLTRNVRAAAVAAAAVVLLTGASSAPAQAQLPAHPVDPQIADGTAQAQLNAARQRWQTAHTDENVKGWVQESFLARVTPYEKSRPLGTVEPAAHRLPL